MNFKEIALDMTKRGFLVVPLRPMRKSPLLFGWNALATNDPVLIDDWHNGKFDRLDGPDGEWTGPDGRTYQNNSWANGSFSNENNLPVGCCCLPGVGNLCVLDIDAEGVVEQLEQETGKTIPDTFTVQSRPETAPYKKHFYFWQTEYSFQHLSKTIGSMQNGKRYDLKINGQAVAPGCLHTSTGKPYEIFKDAPTIPMPDWLVDWIVADVAKYKKQVEDGGGFKLPEEGTVLPEGHRYPYLRALSVQLRKAGCHADAIYEELRQYAIDYCEGGKAYADKMDKNLRQLANTAEEKFNPDPVVYVSDAGSSCTMKWKKLSDVKPEVLEWLWNERIPLRGVTAFAGDPGIGKTTFTLDLIARGSVGSAWLDGKPNTIGSFETVLLSAEDDTSAVLVPRLVAMGADLTKVHIPEPVQTAQGEREFSLDKDLHEIRLLLDERPQIKLIVIDPLSNYCPGKNLNNEQEARSILMPINRICQDYNIAAICIFHNSKTSGRSALHKTIGAVGQVGACRMGWSFMRNISNPDHTLCLQMKQNLGKFDGIEFTTESKVITIDGELSDQATVKYLGQSEEQADVVVSKQEDPKFKENQIIMTKLNQIFKNQTSIPVQTVDDLLQSSGITSLSKISQVMAQMGIESKVVNGDYSYVKTVKS